MLWVFRFLLILIEVLIATVASIEISPSLVFIHPLPLTPLALCCKCAFNLGQNLNSRIVFFSEDLGSMAMFTCLIIRTFQLVFLIETVFFSHDKF